jgi:hypothetical protein
MIWCEWLSKLLFSFYGNHLFLASDLKFLLKLHAYEVGGIPAIKESTLFLSNEGQFALHLP